MTDPERLASLAECFEAQPVARRLFLILWDARGRILPHESLAARMRDLTADYATTMGLRSGIRDLRRGLERAGWPVRIVTHYGLGYQMIVPKGWTWAGQGAGEGA